jgi:hypothetical protein
MDRPPIKGLARALRPAHIRRGHARSLSRFSEHALFESAEVLSEGGLRSQGESARSYYGSTMITFDLDDFARRFRGPLDAAGRQELCQLVEGSVRVRLLAARIACAEVARRVTERPLGTAIVETRVKLAGHTLQMDIDLEVPVGVSSRTRRAT